MGEIDLSAKGFNGGEGSKFISVIRGNASEYLGKLVYILLFELPHGSGNTGDCLTVDANGTIAAGQPLRN